MMRKILVILTSGMLFALGLSAYASQRTIVIDPGHGGTRASGSDKERTLSSPNNAKTPSGILEKDLTLELSREIGRCLERKGFRAVLTRIDDTNPDFAKRAEIASAANPSAVVSIHFNASKDHSALGTLAMVSASERNPRYEADLEFSEGLSKAVSAVVSLFVASSKPRSVMDDGHLHGGLGSNFFYQMAKHNNLDTVPKCFLEVEFIDRADVDGTLVAQRRAAFPKIAEAAADFFSSHLSADPKNPDR